MDGIKDIVPDLLQAILDAYHDNISKNKELQDLIDTIKEGKGDYNTMLKAATLYGNCLSGAFAKNIDADILPDGKMYYNIAERLLTPLVKENYDNVAPLCMDAQQVLNKQNGINLQPVKPSYKVDKTKGMASYVSNGDTYNQRMWSFLQSLETNSKSIVDDSVKENCEFQAKSGMSPVIERHASSKACEWCQEIEGTYKYPYDVPNDVYRRHDNCNCTVVYKPDKRAKDFQDVWSKEWNNKEIHNRINQVNKPSENNDEFISKIADVMAVKDSQTQVIGLTIDLPDRIVPRSVGARYNNPEIIDLNTGMLYHLVEGSRITNIKIFAGKGSRTPYRNAYIYARRYGNKPEDWSHVKGIAEIEGDFESGKVEIHWSESDETGMVDPFIKKWL